MALRHWPMKSLSPWHTNAAVCASAFIKPAEIRQSSRRTDLGREHNQYVFLAKPLQSSSFSESKHSHEQAKANTCGLLRVEYRSPVLLFAAKTRYMSVLILRP